MTFPEAVRAFYEPLGPAHHMVLATADGARVSARMMSVIRLNDRFYFQTDVTLRKHAQLQRNPRAALANEVLYVLEPDFAQKWIYQGGQPFVERLDYASQAYEKRPCLGR